jgi:hypothetical protein
MPVSTRRKPSPGHARDFVGARLAGEGAREIAIAGKPGSYRFGVNLNPESPAIL